MLERLEEDEDSLEGILEGSYSKDSYPEGSMPERKKRSIPLEESQLIKVKSRYERLEGSRKKEEPRRNEMLEGGRRARDS